MRSITQIVKQFKQNWIKELDDDSIAKACRDAGMTWLDSMLNPVVTVQIFLIQILIPRKGDRSILLFLWSATLS